MTLCIAPMCQERAVHKHHIVYAQQLVRCWKSANRSGEASSWQSLAALRRDARNLAPICLKDHASHHNRFAVLPLACLPSDAFFFAEELMGAGAAFEYLRRTYRGDDPRLDYLKGRAA